MKWRGVLREIRRHVLIYAALAPFLLIYPLPYYIVNPFPRYKHPIEPVMLILIVYVLAEARAVELHWPTTKPREASG